MYLVAIAWLYVTLMMAVVEATSPTGSVLGAVITFVFYGLLPLGLVMYILGTPGRKRALRQRQQAEQAAINPAAESAAPDAGGKATTAAQGDAVTPVRKEP